MWNYNQVSLVIPVCGAVWLQDHLTIVVRVPQLAHDLTILAIALNITVSLTALVYRMRVNILVHKRRVFTVGVLLDESRVWLVVFIAVWHVIENLW